MEAGLRGGTCKSRLLDQTKHGFWRIDDYFVKADDSHVATERKRGGTNESTRRLDLTCHGGGNTPIPSLRLSKAS